MKNDARISDPGTGRIRLGLAVISLKEGRYEDAAREFARVAEVSPLYDASHVPPEIFYRGQEEGTAALIREFERMAGADPENAMIRTHLGILYKVRETDAALACFGAAVRANPAGSWPGPEPGNLYQAEKRYDDAAREFGKVPDPAPDNEPALLRTVKKFDDALDILRSGLIMEPVFLCRI